VQSDFDGAAHVRPRFSENLADLRAALVLADLIGVGNDNAAIFDPNDVGDA